VLFLVAGSLIATFVTGRAADASATAGEADESIRRIILSPASSTMDVSNALRQTATTGTDFLPGVFNDARFSDQHRRLCLFSFIRSLGRSPRTISDFAALLQHPSWIAEQDIHECWALTGYLPVTLDMGGDVITIEVFPESEKHSSVICLSFPRPVTANAVFRALHGEKLPSVENIGFKEIGLIEAGNPDANQEALQAWLKDHPKVRQPSR
jgi:hypothetical protein